MNLRTMTLRELLHNRPMAIGILDDLAGYSFWNHLDLQVPVFCRTLKLDEEELAKLLAAMPAEPIDGNWQDKPLYCLVDHLTADHREFRARDLPQMQRLFELIRLEFPENPTAINAFISDFQSFRRELFWHMDEEEEFLFPKILRTEACLHHTELYPETFKGSLTMFPKAQWSAPEEAFRDMLAQLTAKFKELISDLHQLPVVREILTALQSYEAKLKAHAYLEAEVLFTRTVEMETRLLERASRDLSSPVS